MRGIIVRVVDEWLERVAEDAPERFALGRLDRSRPAWSEPGDPWFLVADEAHPAVAAQAEFVDHELMSPAEAFDQFGYGTGALSVENLCSQLSTGGFVHEDDLCGFVILASLERWHKPLPLRELTERGIEPPAVDALSRLTEADTRTVRQAGGL